MSKTNINFDDTNYSIEESSLSPASTEFQSHLLTVLNGDGAVINLGDTVYNIDSTKLSTAKNGFISHLGTITGDGLKIFVGNIEYGVDSTKTTKAITDLTTLFSSLNSATEEADAYIAGLYQTGAVDLYIEQGAEAIADMLVTPWNDLVADGTLIVNDGVVKVGFDEEGEPLFDSLEGDLLLPTDGSVTSIGNNSFNECFYLTGITIPDSVTSIDGFTFDGCDSLTSIAVSENNLTYSSKNGVLFDKDKTKLIYCPNAKKGGYTVPDNVTTISSNAFGGCSLLTSIIIPDSVTNIEHGAFGYCDSLISITIPDSVTTIGSCMFIYCESLTSITIPDGVTSIGSLAFEYCYSLTNITIPDSVTSIEHEAFSHCESLTNITIPNSVISIGRDTFSNCSNLTSVTIGNGITNIGDCAFEGCDKLTTINVSWAQDEVAGAPWGATQAKINYNYIEE